MKPINEIYSDFLLGKVRFDKIVETSVISASEKTDYDDFYTTLRNPVAHGLTYRLFEPMLGKAPQNIFETDVNHMAVYCKASELLLNKIYEIMAVKNCVNHKNNRTRTCTSSTQQNLLIWQR